MVDLQLAGELLLGLTLEILLEQSNLCVIGVPILTEGVFMFGTLGQCLLVHLVQVA
jgi:hypothetical protein